MPRYVDIEPYEHCFIVANSEDSGIKCKDIPTADVQKAKHGKWEKYKRSSAMCRDIYAIDFRCSVCHNFRFHNGEMREKYKFCPNCGARMDGDAE